MVYIYNLRLYKTHVTCQPKFADSINFIDTQLISGSLNYSALIIIKPSNHEHIFRCF